MTIEKRTRSRRPKRTVLCALGLVLLLLFTSSLTACEKAEESETESNADGSSLEDLLLDESFDPYMYFRGTQTLIRFNKLTGEATSVCSDPICTHDTPECDFHRMFLPFL